MKRMMTVRKPLHVKLMAAVTAVVLAFGLLGGVFRGLGSFKSAFAETAEPSTYIFNASDLAEQTYTENFKTGTDDFFTVLATSSKSVTVDGSPENHKGMDGLSFTRRLKMGGTGKKTERALKFEAASEGSVTVYATTGSTTDPATRPLILNSDNAGFTVKQIDISNALDKAIFTFEAAGTYYLYSGSSGMNIYYAAVTAGKVEIVRKDWAEVADPVIGAVTQEGATLSVPFTMDIGNDGADRVTIEMYKGDTLVTSKTASSADTTALTFNPPASGDYTFKIKAERDGEATVKTAAADTDFDGFVLPLVAPAVRGRTGKGGTLTLTVTAVKEATSYIVSYQKQGAEGWNDLAELTPATLSDEYVLSTPALEVGATYNLRAVAKRGGETSAEGTATALVRDAEEFDWLFTAFGPSSNTANNKVTGNIYDGLKIESTAGKGKLQDGGADGGAFYYVPVDKSKNFELSATVKVDSWTYSNAQEGFMVFARDARPEQNSADQYSNSYGFVASKVEYTFDTDSREESPMGDSKISMRIGIGSRSISGLNHATDTTQNKAVAVTRTLETSAGLDGQGNHNLITNHNNTAPTAGSIDTVRVTLKKTNTGFYVIYTDDAGKATTHVLYDWENMFVIDEDTVYVGFMAARNMTVSVSDIRFVTSDVATDPPAEERPIEKLHPEYRVTSSTTSGLAQYKLRFSANADGKLEIKKDGATVEANIAITALTEFGKSLTLTKGANNYSVIFTPDPTYKPSEFVEMGSYDPVTILHTVIYQNYGTSANKIYVSPVGSSTNNGSKEKPIDIVTAFKYAQPGQTFILTGGTYSLGAPLTIARGIDGTQDKPITVISDDAQRAVLDFKKSSAGIVHWGNYWIFRGFDVTNTLDMQKGFQVSGNYNNLIELNTYNNGNTGIQISGISTETFDMWPAYNNIINCTSYNNADKGYEDADGFAAKLTSGPGNVFDGCIAYNNADDGWDMFAKTITGPIGAVVIRNCIAYGNGFLSDGTVAGNGNGFKMGGTSIVPVDEDGQPAQHILENSLSYNNKAKGIDSNSCPAIKAVNSVSYNNGSYNVAFYTNAAAATNFGAEGVISFKDDNAASKIGESIRPVSQDSATIYTDKNYFFNGTKSVNSAGAEITADMFVSLDTTVKPTRYANGSVNVNGLLQLTDAAAQTVTGGAKFTQSTCPSPETAASGTPIDGTDPTAAFDSDMVKKAKAGEKISLKFTCSDNVTAQSALIIEVSATRGTEKIDVPKADGVYSFTAKDAGSYEIVIKVTDEAGNFKIIRHTVEVEKRSGCSAVSAGTIGIVLPALALLAGAALLLLKKKSVTAK